MARHGLRLLAEQFFRRPRTGSTTTFGTPEPAVRQNDFGGTFGGPVEIPGLYNGKDKTFFFVSYEGLRLTQPQAATVNYVPDAALRASAPCSPLQSEC